MSVISSEVWDNFLSRHPQAHILQTSGWGTLKAEFGWKPVRVLHNSCGAQILFRQLPLGLTVGYIPKGPVGTPSAGFWREVDGVCKELHAVFLKIEPDRGDTHLENLLPAARASKPIQPGRTLCVSLAGSESDWLRRMKQKTRYNIRLSQRKDLSVRQVNQVKPSRDIELFYEMMKTTGSRDQFGVHSKRYYQRAFEIFNASTPSQGNCALFIAEYENHPLAGVMAFARGLRAWYFYGASTNEERNRMPAYLVQWEAMRWAGTQGCTDYDLWGVPDHDEAELEDKFTDRSDGLWGVYRFKRGFGGHMITSPGAWDHVYRPTLYSIYRTWMSRRPTGDG